MDTKAAVEEVLDTGLSKYALAKALGCFPVSVNQWLRGTKMSDKYSDKFTELYGITIDDTVPLSNRTS